MHSVTPTASRLMTADEVAHLLQIHPRTVYAMARMGQIPSRRVGRSVRFLPAEIEAWIEAQR